MNVYQIRSENGVISLCVGFILFYFFFFFNAHVIILYIQTLPYRLQVLLQSIRLHCRIFDCYSSNIQLQCSNRNGYPILFLNHCN